MKAKLRLLVCCFLFASFQLLPSQLQGQTAGPANPEARHPAYSIRASVQLRTPAEMDEAERTAVSPAPPTTIPFRSTISAEELAARKAGAALQVPSRQRTATSRRSVALPAAVISPPVLKGTNVNGVSQGSGILVPPDTHGAVGASQFLEMVNQRFAVYSKANPPALLKNVSLASFFGYTAPFPGLFDPRVIYDRTWKRWIVTANALHESAGVQKLLIAVSKTSDATGAFYVSRDFNTDVPHDGQFSDFPQLGMDQDAIILTTNVFSDEGSNPTYLGSEVITFAKARAYNGLELEAQFFNAGTTGTIAPPIVLDQNPDTFLVAAPPSGSSLSLFTLTNSSRGSGALLAGPVSVLVDPYNIPPDAAQPETGNLLATLDSRFVNASTQVEDTLWQTHTVAGGALRPRPGVGLSGFATPFWYKINTETQTVAESGFFFASGTSYDFNASIVANEEGDMFVTWSSTDPEPAPPNPPLNVQVRFSGRTVGDPETDLSPGTALFTSPTSYFPGLSFPERWGDYSAITIDPANDMQAWLVNEKANSTSKWGSRIGRIGFPSP